MTCEGGKFQLFTFFLVSPSYCDIKIMGVEGLSKLLRDPKHLANHLSELRGAVVGVDGFVLLHRILLSKACIREFHQVPPTDLYTHVS